MRGFVKFKKKIYIDIYIIRTKFHRFFFKINFSKVVCYFRTLKDTRETATSLYHGFVLLKGSDPF